METVAVLLGRLEAGAELSFDNSATAQLYSQTTGLLAGFAFTGIILILTSRLERHSLANSVHSALGRALILLLGAFAGLAVASVSDGIVAGEGNDLRASVQHSLAGLGFGVAALLLLLALHELVCAVEPKLEGFTHSLVAGAGPFVVVGLLCLGTMDVANRAIHYWGPPLHATILFAAGVQVLALGFVSANMKFRWVNPALTFRRSVAETSAAVVVAVSFLASIAVAVVSSIPARLADL